MMALARDPPGVVADPRVRFVPCSGGVRNKILRSKLYRKVIIIIIELLPRTRGKSLSKYHPFVFSLPAIFLPPFRNLLITIIPRGGEREFVYNTAAPAPDRTCGRKSIMELLKKYRENVLLKKKKKNYTLNH